MEKCDKSHIVSCDFCDNSVSLYYHILKEVSMYRCAFEQLLKWKHKKNKKPLIIRGARQVGKTWLMKDFGKKEFLHTVYVNLDNNQTMKQLFSTNLDITRIITGLELYSG